MRTLIKELAILSFPIIIASQSATTIPVGKLLAERGYLFLYLEKAEISSSMITCHFFFRNKLDPYYDIVSDERVGLKGAHADNYRQVELNGMMFGREYRLLGQSEKKFVIRVSRPVSGLYLTGINLSGSFTNVDIKLSSDFTGRVLCDYVDISSAVQTVPFRSVPAHTQPTAKKDTKIPTISLSSPRTTQGIYRTEDFSVIISGNAQDEEGIAFVNVNGQNASLRSDGHFQKRMKLKIGKNPVKIRAIDINDNIAELTINIIREEIIEDEEFSDVDFAPETGNKNRNGIAVVFGIEEYQYAPTVTYAYNDADIFREYLVKTFGYSRENIYFRTNERATKGEFDKVFSENGWIEKNTTRKSDVIIFYAGHGSPYLEEEQSYLVPYDIDPNYATTGYALDELYQNLGKLKVNSITVILDACFSGGTRDSQPLLADARPVYISVEGSMVPKNTVVFSAASGKEISSAYKQKLHGLFTYFFLKGLNGDADENKDKKITVMEMQGYLEAYVPQQARKMGREQTPTLIGKDSKRILLKY